MALTAAQVKSIVCPEEKKQIKKFDEKGLFVLVKQSGSKLWRFKYKYGGKHQEMALGQYPSVTLSEARKMADKARLLLVQGINPMEKKLERKRALKSPERFFDKVALVWWENKKDAWGDDYTAKIKRLITNDLKPLHKYPIELVEAHHIKDIMLSVEAAGTPKKASLLKSILDRIFRYAISHEKARKNPVEFINLNDLLKPMPKVQSYAAIVNPSSLGQLIHDIDNNQAGAFCTIEALKLIPRVFLRPNEVRNLKWEYIDFDSRLIYLPEEIMKGEREHLVPLAKQVILHLQQIHAVTSYSPYVFPNNSNSNKPISKNVLTNRLRDLGYSADIMSAHGFRSTASTILHEQGWEHDVVETQLAHLTGTETSRAYNRAKYLKQRKEMMQAWGDYLDKIKAQ